MKGFNFKMNNKNLLRASCFVFVVMIIMLVLLFKVNNTNKNLTKELNDNETELLVAQEELISAQTDLTNVQHSLIAETKKLTDTQNELKLTKQELNDANAIIESLDGDDYLVNMSVTEKEINAIAKTVWGEARGCNKLEQSAVVWCILNRVDAGYGSIVQVITAPRQFHGYSREHPVTAEIKELVQDVIARWLLEKFTCGDVGRTLPSNYLYFSADGTGIGNVFRTAWDGNYTVWDWNCYNPYQD